MLTTFLLAKTTVAENTFLSPEFWGAFCGILVLLFALYEGAKRFNWVPPTKAERQIDSMEERFSRLFPEDLKYEETPVGIALAQTKDSNEKTTHLNKVHEIPEKFGESPPWYCALKDQSNPYQDLFKNLEHSVAKMLEEVAKLAESDTQTTLQFTKIIQVMRLHTKRLKLLQEKTSVSPSRELELLEEDEENG